MTSDPMSFFQQLAESGRQKSVENLAAIDEMNESHLVTCENCQAGNDCQDMNLRRLYRDATSNVVADYDHVARELFGHGKV